MLLLMSLIYTRMLYIMYMHIRVYTEGSWKVQTAELVQPAPMILQKHCANAGSFHVSHRDTSSARVHLSALLYAAST